MITNHNITLNLPYDLSEEDWLKVVAVYKSINGYIEPTGSDIPSWYGTEHDNQYIYVSIEPSGLSCHGKIGSEIWTGWLTQLCSRLSLALNREVSDAEM